MNNKYIKLSSLAFYPTSNLNIKALKIVSREKNFIYNYKYTITDVVNNNIENNTIKLGQNNYFSFENGIIQQRDYVVLFRNYITRTIPIKNSFEYKSFINNGGTIYSTNIAHFMSYDETLGIIIRDTTDNIISFNNFKLDSKFIIYSIDNLPSSNDSNYDELIIKLNPEYTFKINKEYTFTLTINNEDILFSLYYDTSDLICLNLDTGVLTYKNDIDDDNINRPLEFNNIIESL